MWTHTPSSHVATYLGMFTLSCQSACQPVCPASPGGHPLLCLPDCSHHRAVISCSIRTRYAPCPSLPARILSLQCFGNNINRTVASNLDVPRQPLISPKVKRHLSKSRTCCTVRMALSAGHHGPCPCQSVARPRFTSAAAVAPVSGEPPHPPTRAAHLLSAFGTGRA